MRVSLRAVNGSEEGAPILDDLPPFARRFLKFLILFCPPPPRRQKNLGYGRIPWTPARVSGRPRRQCEAPPRPARFFRFPLLYRRHSASSRPHHAPKRRIIPTESIIRVRPGADCEIHARPIQRPSPLNRPPHGPARPHQLPTTSFRLRPITNNRQPRIAPPLQIIQRTPHLSAHSPGHMRVNFRRPHIRMPQQLLNTP